MNKSGFSLLELAIVLLIIGILASVGIPRIVRGTQTEGQKFIARLNTLVSYGAQAASTSPEGAEINFNIKGGTVSVITTGQAPKRTIEIPRAIDIQDFYVNGVNQFSTAGGERLSAYFYISPDGITQEIKIVFDDKSSSKKYTIEINPFTGIFKIV